MKVGVKVFSRPDEVDYAKKMKFADFLELMIVPGTDISLYKGVKKPFVIHAAHHGFGCNLLDKTCLKRNVQILREASKAADILGAETIIVHPGHVLSSSCKHEHAVKILKKEYDPRIVVENLCPLPKELEHRYGLAKDMSKLMKDTKTGLCLDFAHACASAVKEKQDYKVVLKDLIKLKARHFHISGGGILSGQDSHLSLFDGDFPLAYFKKLLPKDAKITLETPHSIVRQKKEYDLMKK